MQLTRDWLTAPSASGVRPAIRTPFRRLKAPQEARSLMPLLVSTTRRVPFRSCSPARCRVHIGDRSTRMQPPGILRREETAGLPGVEADAGVRRKGRQLRSGVVRRRHLHFAMTGHGQHASSLGWHVTQPSFALAARFCAALGVADLAGLRPRPICIASFLRLSA